MYLIAKLEKVGITANKPLDVLKQALKIGTKDAMLTAINCCLMAISWAADQQDVDEKTRKRMHKEFFKLKEVKQLRKKLSKLK